MVMAWCSTRARTGGTSVTTPCSATRQQVSAEVHSQEAGTRQRRTTTYSTRFHFDSCRYTLYSPACIRGYFCPPKRERVDYWLSGPHLIMSDWLRASVSPNDLVLGTRSARNTHLRYPSVHAKRCCRRIAGR